ncbi:Kunitz type trypsin inhibitor / miraculin [Quillaja saponaria]|uniref:Kunitz type trypsin inhibitor / miraculin n=1 Tax=Quillaja saponaria TaxID=32244 RepID=A0AAD7LKQ1_QUISA|nr:Kunitz type trypsin inhibitor / miraculin [Quillaja saponaria]
MKTIPLLSLSFLLFTFTTSARPDPVFDIYVADVIQQYFETFDSLPLTFSPSIQRRGEVHISNDLNIKVSAKTSCAQSTVWKLAKQSNGMWFVTTGGVEGNPGFETITNWFKIEKYGSDYKLAFCPNVVDAPVLCKDLGIHVDEDGKRHLALGDEIPALTVMFKRAKTLQTVVILISKRSIPPSIDNFRSEIGMDETSSLSKISLKLQKP